MWLPREFLRTMWGRVLSELDRSGIRWWGRGSGCWGFGRGASLVEPGSNHWLQILWSYTGPNFSIGITSPNRR